MERGIERIVEACREADIPSPEFRLEATGLWVEFSYAQPHKTTKKTIKKTTKKTGEKTRTNTTEKILDLISADPSLSIQELADKTGISFGGIAWQIKKLKKENRLERVGPDKGGSWKILK